MRGSLSILIVAMATLGIAQAAPGAGKPAPELAGMDLAGRALSLTDYRGKWVYVDFWASWCGPCMRELPRVVSLHNELSQAPNFTVLGVSLDREETRKDLEKAVKRNNVTYPVLYSGSGWGASMSSAWDVNVIPTTFLIDPQGVVVGRDIPVSQVRQLIAQGEMDAVRRTPSQSRGDGAPRITVPADAERAVRPVQVRCSERLLPISLSSGMDGGRDLEITMDLQPERPRLARYRVYLRSTKRVPGSQAVEADWRYDVNILLDTANTRSPFFIEIKDTSDPGKTAGFPAPDLLAALDLDANQCLFIVPLAPDTLKLNYAVALYDEQAGRYVSGR